MSDHPSYTRVFLTFARNSLIRDMTFRTNFLLQAVSSTSWTIMNLGLYLIIFHHLGNRSIGVDSGWAQYEFFIFLATTWFINSLVQAFFMPNAQEFSELIRTGNLDFALLKPIDTQFLISFTKVDWSSLANIATGLALVIYSLRQLSIRAENAFDLWSLVWIVPAYLFYIVCGVLILYSVMIALSATSIWLGRNQTLYNFWFYITNFSRYPMEIYQRGWGWSLWGVFTFAIPILVVVNVPARILARPLRIPEEWPLAVFAVIATAFCLLISRWVFVRALGSYRSASS